MQQVYFHGMINQLLPDWSIINFLQNMHMYLLLMEYYPPYIGTNHICKMKTPWYNTEIITSILL